MVNISSTGEIISDDEPRQRPTSNTGNTNQPRQRQGFVQHAEYNQNAVAHGPTGSIFDSLNERLLGAGLPRFNVGPYTIEPIVSVGFLVIFMLAGFRGILFGLLLFVIVKTSSGGGPGLLGGGGGNNRTARPGGSNPDGGNRRNWGGGGQRLGQS